MFVISHPSSKANKSENKLGIEESNRMLLSILKIDYMNIVGKIIFVKLNKGVLN